MYIHNYVKLLEFVRKNLIDYLFRIYTCTISIKSILILIETIKLEVSERLNYKHHMFTTREASKIYFTSI